MDALTAEIIRQAPAAVLAIGLIVAYARGLIRTAFEVTAWRERAERAERQTDTLLPAMEKLTDSIDKSAGLMEETLRRRQTESRP